MRIAIIGVTGGTGAAAVEQALGHGHEVTAIAREPARVSGSGERLEVVAGDVLDLESMRSVIPGHDGVLSAIGTAPGRDITLYSEGISNIMYAMAESGVPRLVAVSASGTFHRTDRNLQFGYRLMIRTLLRSFYDDLERMEQRIMASALEWTIVRPAGLTDGPLTGTYRIGADGAPLAGGGRVSRADVAAFMLKAAETDQWVRSAVTLAY